jgi:hypothetical protein
VFVTVAELVSRAEWDMTEGEIRLALGTLEHLSEEAQGYGRGDWTVETVPNHVKTLIRKAALRHLRNPENFNQSRAGDETVGWGERNYTDASFTEAEIDQIRRIANPVLDELASIGVYAWSDRAPRELGWVPTTHGKDFPFFDRADDEW